MKENTICEAEDCEKPATKTLRVWNLCLDCYIRTVYDMIPLILKGKTK